MKKLLFIAAIAVGGAAYAQNNHIQSIEIGSNIPMANAGMKSIDGKSVTLSKAITKQGLLVMFSCNTCPYVIKSEARTKEVIDYATRHNIGMVIINSNEAQRGKEDSYNAMSAYAKKQGYKVPYVVDDKSKVADAFGATRTPEVFLFDGNGKLVYKGAMEDNPSSPAESKELFLKVAIDNMLAGKPANPNSTKSIGCTIKRI
ncbi:MAG TPA: thioredoxin family protein [Flavipsychrobacter sp.]